MSDYYRFIGADGKMHRPSDPDYWLARTRELENTVLELTTAIVDLQHRVSRLDGEDLQWPGDTYEPQHTEPFGTGAERVLQLEDRVQRLEIADLRRDENS